MSDSSDLTHVTDYNNTHLISSHPARNPPCSPNQIRLIKCITTFVRRGFREYEFTQVRYSDDIDNNIYSAELI